MIHYALTKLPSSTTIKQLTTTESPGTPAPEQQKIQTGIASTKDSFEAQQRTHCLQQIRIRVNLTLAMDCQEKRPR